MASTDDCSKVDYCKPKRTSDFFEGCGLDWVAVVKLATCRFVGRSENVVLQGLIATGQTNLICTLAKAVCDRRLRSCYIRQPDLENPCWKCRERPCDEYELVRKNGAFGLLVVDEWLLDKTDLEFSSMLMGLMDLRCGTASILICTKFKKKRRSSGAQGSAPVPRRNNSGAV